MDFGGQTRTVHTRAMKGAMRSLFTDQDEYDNDVNALGLASEDEEGGDDAAIALARIDQSYNPLCEAFVLASPDADGAASTGEADYMEPLSLPPSPHAPSPLHLEPSSPRPLPATTYKAGGKPVNVLELTMTPRQRQLIRQDVISIANAPPADDKMTNASRAALHVYQASTDLRAMQVRSKTRQLASFTRLMRCELEDDPINRMDVFKSKCADMVQESTSIDMAYPFVRLLEMHPRTLMGPRVICSTVAAMSKLTQCINAMSEYGMTFDNATSASMLEALELLQRRVRMRTTTPQLHSVTWRAQVDMDALFTSATGRAPTLALMRDTCIVRAAPIKAAGATSEHVVPYRRRRRHLRP